MKKILFIFIVVVCFSKTASAQCSTAVNDAQKSCDKANIKDPLRLLTDMKDYLAKNDTGVATTVKKGIADVTTAKAQVDQFELDCAKKIKACIDSCVNIGEEQARTYCATGEPEKNRQAAKGASGNLSQILPALAQILASLGAGGGGDNTDPCANNPNLCKTDVAAKDQGSTFSNGGVRQSDGDSKFLEAGLNGNDVPAMGESAKPSYAQAGAAGSGSGSGAINAAALAGSVRPKANADGNQDNGIKAASSAAGGTMSGSRGGGGGFGGGSSSSSKGNSNPIASRLSIDNDERALADKAADNVLQARGVASDGPDGGVSHPLRSDNFQKIEKRIQTERNSLSEF